MDSKKSLIYSKKLTVCLIVFLTILAILDQYTTHICVEIVHAINPNIDISEVESNPIVVAILKYYGWTGFHIIKFVSIGILAFILLKQNKLYIQATCNAVMLLIILVYIYAVTQNFMIIDSLQQNYATRITTIRS